MRKVDKDFDRPPVALQQGFEEKKEDLLEKGSAHRFDGRIYNNAVKRELMALYHRKCAYCETVLSDDTFTVEHYRPKSGSYAYYWLAYEWSNLLPVCSKCNYAKGDRFPVRVPSRVMPDSDKKSRVKRPKRFPNGVPDMNAMKADHPYLLDEQPYLLHPEIDEPGDFLSVSFNGELTPLNNEATDAYGYRRSMETIRLVNLNRDALVLNRRRVIEDLEVLLKKQTIRFLKERNNQDDLDSSIRLAYFVIFEVIEKRLEDDQEYTMAGWSVWINIEEMLFKEIHKDNQEIKRLLDYAFSLYNQSKK